MTPALEAITVTGERIGYDMCFAPECLQPIDRCRCDNGPTHPASDPTPPTSPKTVAHPHGRPRSPGVARSAREPSGLRSLGGVVPLPGAGSLDAV